MSSTDFSIIIHGKPCGRIFASRRPRQICDHYAFSPFLFYIGVDVWAIWFCLQNLEAPLEGLKWGRLDNKYPLLFYNFLIDIILFSYANQSLIYNLFVEIKDFEAASQLKINVKNQSSLDSPWIIYRFETFEAKIGCNVGNWLATYLHFLLGKKPKTSVFWSLSLKVTKNTWLFETLSYIQKRSFDPYPS